MRAECGARSVVRVSRADRGARSGARMSRAECGDRSEARMSRADRGARSEERMVRADRVARNVARASRADRVVRNVAGMPRADRGVRSGARMSRTDQDVRNVARKPRTGKGADINIKETARTGSGENASQNRRERQPESDRSVEKPVSPGGTPDAGAGVVWERADTMEVRPVPGGENLMAADGEATQKRSNEMAIYGRR